MTAPHEGLAGSRWILQDVLEQHRQTARPQRATDNQRGCCAQSHREPSHPGVWLPAWDGRQDEERAAPDCDAEDDVERYLPGRVLIIEDCLLERPVPGFVHDRSEERRVGKECRSR